MKLISAHRIFFFWLAMLSGVAAFARTNDDTLWPKHSLRLEIAGKDIFGAGLTFERAWRNPNNVKHPNAFSSVDVNIGWVYSEYIITSIGINRNWYLGEKKKWTINCGLAIAGLICVDPTSRELREYYDSIVFFGGEYINPIEPWLLGNISCRYTFHRLFLQGSFTPILFYDRAYDRGFIYGPWGGVSLGINLKNRKGKKAN